MDRRTFLILVGLGTMVGTLETVVKAQTTRHSTEPDSIVAQASGFQQVGQLSQLSRPQDQIQARVSDRRIVVIRDPANSNTILAFDRSCPHDGCNVNWSGNQSQFVCPCHDAQFNAHGAVTQGPARSPLTSYPVRVNGNNILVQVV